MSCQSLLEKCLENTDLNTLHEYLSPTDQDGDFRPQPTYLTPEEFNTCIFDNKKVDSNKLSLVHVNIRSMKSKLILYDSLSLFLSSLDVQLSITGI